MCCLPSDLEDLDFLDLETLPTRENDLLVQSGVVGVSAAKPSVTVGVCVAVIENSNVTSNSKPYVAFGITTDCDQPITTTKTWTAFGITPDCPVLLFGLQRKSPRRDVVRILQREKKTFPTVIRLRMIIP
jgi:hypothetical protein